jgi:hypothetical protein
LQKKIAERNVLFFFTIYFFFGFFLLRKKNELAQVVFFGFFFSRAEGPTTKKIIRFKKKLFGLFIGPKARQKTPPALKKHSCVFSQAFGLIIN